MSKGRARLAISHGLSVWVLEAPDGFGDAGVHAHHAIQLTVVLSGALSVTGGAGPVEAPAIAVAADAEHAFAAHGLLAFIFIEPEGRLGRSLSQRLFGEARVVALDHATLAPLLAPLRVVLDDPAPDSVLLESGRAAAELLAREMPGAAAVLPDPRVRRIIDYASAHLHEPLSLASASHGVHLSPSRLRHLFVEQTGLPFKTYVLWLRLTRAVQIYATGRSLTDAAHGAGFSDSAHFSRVFRRTFGLPATTLTRL